METVNGTTRYFLHLGYWGPAFHGWQRQPGQTVTVQGVLEEGLQIILRQPVALTGSGRTDTGVHALEQWAHFDWPAHLPLPDGHTLLARLNGWLPVGVAIYALYAAPDGLHARFDAILRRYRYQIVTRKDPFWYERAWWIHQPLDTEKMQLAADKLLAYNDFASFCKLGGNNKTTICRIFSSKISTENGVLTYIVEGDRFLRGMVRAIVGTLVDIGRGKLSLEAMDVILEARNRSAASQAAPPYGLYLEKIGYPPNRLLPIAVLPNHAMHPTPDH